MTRRRLSRAALEEVARPAHVVLLLVLAVGTVMRFKLMLDYRPGFLGYPDSGPYLFDALTDAYPFYDPLRVTGYAIVLHQLHSLSPNLSVVTLFQHLLGLGSALAFYLTARIAGLRSRWIGVIPAAVVSLNGIEIMFEHALITETVWLSLIAIGLLLCVAAARAWSRAPVGLVLAAVSGLLVGASVTVRLPSLFMLPVMLLWLLVVTPGGWVRRIAGPALMLVAAVLPIYGYAKWQEANTGRFGLSRNGALNLYGRAAPWADCTKFTPPKGTEMLCESTPIKDRVGHDAYIFAASPATNAFNVHALTDVLSAADSKKLSAWSKAAILGQPFTYAKAVLRESRRIIDPGAKSGMPGQGEAGYGLPPSSYGPLLENTGRDVFIVGLISDHYGGPASTQFIHGDVSWLDSYEKATRVPPILMAMMIALAIMAPFATRGPERRLAWLFMPVAIALLEMPVVTSLYDYRYIVPVFGVLALPAAIGGWGVVASTRGWWRARRARRAGGETRAEPTAT